MSRLIVDVRLEIRLEMAVYVDQTANQGDRAMIGLGHAVHGKGVSIQIRIIGQHIDHRCPGILSDGVCVNHGHRRIVLRCHGQVDGGGIGSAVAVRDRIGRGFVFGWGRDQAAMVIRFSWVAVGDLVQEGGGGCASYLAKAGAKSPDRFHSHSLPTVPMSDSPACRSNPTLCGAQRPDDLSAGA
jgi:hypothetical protein